MNIFKYYIFCITQLDFQLSDVSKYKAIKGFILKYKINLLLHNLRNVNVDLITSFRICSNYNNPLACVIILTSQKKLFGDRRFLTLTV